jgi:hypothetical protein
MSNGNTPAMPVIEETKAEQYNGATFTTATAISAGLTKREMFAMQFAGHIWVQYQNDGTAAQYDNWREGVCVESVRLADALLAELECTK